MSVEPSGVTRNSRKSRHADKPYSRKTVRKIRPHDEIIRGITSEIAKLTDEIGIISGPDFSIGTGKIPCPFSYNCLRVDPKHFEDFSHTNYDAYLLEIKAGIELAQPSIQKIISDTYEGYNSKDSDIFMDTWRRDIAHDQLGPGAIYDVPFGSGKKRFFPENTPYFYLLANLHKYFEDYASKSRYRDKRFFEILFMRMEELYDATGLYQMTPHEYITIFEPKINLKYFDIGANFNGVNREPNGLISLANTSLLAAFQKLAPPIREIRGLTFVKGNASTHSDAGDDAGGGGLSKTRRKIKKIVKRKITRRRR